MPVSTATPAKRSKKAEQRAEMMEQILDAAEYLFSQRGLYGVTLKDVAQRVGVHHTLMNYYFTDKKKLFDDVFARRAEISRVLRMEALERYEVECGGKPTVLGCLQAFLDTDLDLYIRSGEGWRNFTTLGAQAVNAPWGAELFDKHFDDLILKLVGLLKRALPECDEVDIFWCYHFVSGALMLTLARTGRIDRLSGGLCSSDDFHAVKERMAHFMAAGFIEICKQQSAAKKAAAPKSPAKRTRK